MFGTKLFLMFWCNAHLNQNPVTQNFECPITGEVAVPAQNLYGFWVIRGWSEERLGQIEDHNFEFKQAS